jgi:hypothetical protein
LQQIVFEAKNKFSKLSVLDLLKEPNSDNNLNLLYSKFGLDKSFRSMSFKKDQNGEVMKMTLLDQILQMIIDYIKLLGIYPEAFEYQESQEREFNRWK